MINKFTKRFLLFVFATLAVHHAYAQAPNISYTVPQQYKLNTSINPLVPGNNGGAVPVGQYGAVSSFAGTGQYSYIDGAVNVASFKIPSDLVIDKNNNIYVSDFPNQVIRKISPEGQVSTFAGNGYGGRNNGPGDQASFYGPTGMAINADGNIYVTDQYANEIRKITPAGFVSSVAGSGFIGKLNGNGSAASFSSPQALAFGPDGALYVADMSNAMIRRVTLSGDVTTFSENAGQPTNNGPGSQVRLGSPQGIAFNSKGDCYVGDVLDPSIRKVARDGTLSVFAGSGEYSSNDGTGIAASFKNPHRLLFDANDNLYVADGNRIRKITPQGIVTTIAGTDEEGDVDGVGSAARLSGPVGMAFDKYGIMYFGEISSHKIRKLTLNGYSIDKPLPPGLSFNTANGIISGTPNVLFPPTVYTITARNNSGASSVDITISIVHDLPPAPPVVQAPVITYNTPNTYTAGMQIVPLVPQHSGGAVPATGYARVSTFAGGGPVGTLDGQGQNALFRFPQGISLGEDGNLYVGDTDNNRIRKITPNANVTTFAGSGVVGIDNGLGTAATLQFPHGSRMDKTGTLYFADRGNNRIRKISPAGEVSSFSGNGNLAIKEGPVAEAGYLGPTDMVFDVAGNMFVTDMGGNSIRKITTTGIVSTFAGGGGGGFRDGFTTTAKFFTPWGIIIDKADNLYVADSQNNLIRKITPAGLVSTLAGSGDYGADDGQGRAASFKNPSGITIDEAGNLFITDNYNCTIRKITPEGMVTTIAGSPGFGLIDDVGILAKFYAPVGIVYDKKGSLFVADANNHRIRKISLWGYAIDKPLPPGLVFNTETGIISGTPTAYFPATIYTVTAYNEGGSGSTKLQIAGNDALPAISYASPKTYIAGYPIAPLVPVIGGGAVPPVGYRAETPLPAGLLVDPNTGTISGTPLSAYPAAAYRITATNAGGTVTTIINIEILNAPPPASELPKIDYASPKVYTINRPIVPLVPSRSGGAVEPNGYSINIPLPAGLVFDTNTGVISGTPTALSPATIYTVTAKNAAGTRLSLINIKIGDEILAISPRPDIRYPTPQTLYLRTPIAPLIPANTGGDVLRYSNGLLTAFAGTGQPGRTDGPKDAARFDNPVKATIDGSGNFYVTDFNNFSLRKITPGGIVSTIAGAAGPGYTNGPLGTSQLQAPRGIVTDRAGNIYVADVYAIRKITPAGITSTFAGSNVAGKTDGNGTTARFDGVVNLAIDNADNIYAVDQANGLIRKISPAGLVTTIAGNNNRANVDGQGSAASFNNPQDIAFYNGEFYIADYLTVRKMTAGGMVTTIAGNGIPKVVNGPAIQAGFGNASAIGINSAGDIYILDSGNNVPNEGNAIIRIIDKDNNVSTAILTDGAGIRTYLKVPNSITFGKNGLIYIGTGDNNIQTLSFDRYTIDRPLPAGLIFDTATGQISGTPTVLSPESDYIITAYNNGGNTPTVLKLKVIPNEAKIPSIITFPEFATNPVWDSGFNIDPQITRSQTETPLVLSSSNTAVVTINPDNTLHIISAGQATITATQAGNDFYLDAQPVMRTITITRANPITSFPAISEKTACDADFSVSGTSTNNGSPIVYSSSNPDVATVNQAGMVHIIGVGTTEIKVTQAASELYNTMPDELRQLVVTVSNAQIPAPTVSISTPSVKVFEGERVTFIVTTSGTAASYQWKVNDENAGTNVETFNTNTLQDGDRVTCTITFTNRCILPVKSSPLMMQVFPPPVVISPPNTFSPNNDGINDTWKIPALISYPNCTVRIFNRNGTLLILSRGYSKPWDGTYQGKDSPAGVYYYVITPGDGQAAVSGSITILR